LIVETEFADWDESEGTTVYAGPNVHYQGNQNWWVTFTPTIQLSDQEGEANYNFRLIAGYEF
jgi:hypothetical protein